MLQQRDIHLLADLHSYGCMLRSQIERLYFGSVQRANARLRQLFDARYVVRAQLSLPSGGGAGRSCQIPYMLGPMGIPVVARELGIDPPAIRLQQRRGTPAYLLHTIEIVSFRLAVEDAVRSQSDVRMESFFPERMCCHSYQYREQAKTSGRPDASWRNEVYKPDAVMLLAWPSGGAGFAIEIDLGHTGASEFLTKLRIHTRYAHSGLFLKRYGVETAQTLVITTSAKRRDNLKMLVERAESNRFWFSTFDEVATGGVLGAIWHVPFQEGCARLQPLCADQSTAEYRSQTVSE